MQPATQALAPALMTASNQVPRALGPARHSRRTAMVAQASGAPCAALLGLSGGQQCGSERVWCLADRLDTEFNQWGHRRYWITSLALTFQASVAHLAHLVPTGAAPVTRRARAFQ